MNDKFQFLNVIRSNISKFGYHITVVNSEIEPRYAYTIGLKDLFGYELIFAGGIYYLKDELFQIFKGLVDNLKANPDLINEKLPVDNLGIFSFSKTHPSWNSLMVLGVFDYFGIDNIEVMQVIPDAHHYTKDIPDMTKTFNQSSEPVWQWLSGEWTFNVPLNSTVVTNIDSLKGKPITELMRWENNEWEMFAGAGSDVDKKDIRVTSLGTMIGIDDSLISATNLAIGKGLWRENSSSDWNGWG